MKNLKLSILVLLSLLTVSCITSPNLPKTESKVESVAAVVDDVASELIQVPTKSEKQLAKEKYAKEQEMLRSDSYRYKVKADNAKDYYRNSKSFDSANSFKLVRAKKYPNRYETVAERRAKGDLWDYRVTYRYEGWDSYTDWFQITFYLTEEGKLVKSDRASWHGRS